MSREIASASSAKKAGVSMGVPNHSAWGGARGPGRADLSASRHRLRRPCRREPPPVSLEHHGPRRRWLACPARAASPHHHCNASRQTANTGRRRRRYRGQIIPLDGVPHRRCAPIDASQGRRSATPPHLAQQIAPPRSASRGEASAISPGKQGGARPRGHHAVFWWA